MKSINSQNDSYPGPLRELLLSAGPLSAEEAQQRLGISQATFSRTVAATDGVAMLGRGKATRYALARPIATVGAEMPLYQVSEAGSPSRIATLIAISGGRYWLQPPQGLGELHDDLPFFLQDMRPQGYLGRLFPAAHVGLPVPPRIADWNSDHVAIALARAGEDLIGDLVLGKESADKLLARPPREPVSEGQIPSQYPLLAKRTRDGEPVGSSAGGEQPKFEVYRQRDDGSVFHAIVKFSPPMDTPAGRRWADLLACEFLAHQQLLELGVPASRSRYLEIDGRAFLEVERFDRVGPIGRRGVISLGAVDDHFFGQRDRYSLAGERLVRAGMLPEEDARQLALIEAFGLLIANEDMHFGNVSLFARGPFDRRYRLAPAYDMLPMRYRPRDEDPAPAPPFAMPAPHTGVLEAWPRALAAAREYWMRVLEHEAISQGFKAMVAPLPEAMQAR